MNAQGLDDDLDDAIHQALLNAVGCELAFAATEAVCEVLAARRDALADMRDDTERRPAGWLVGF